MDNQTSIKYFQILAFSSHVENHRLLFAIFLVIYVTGLLGNLVILIAVFVDSHLHTPMYFFLCNLSSLDIIFTTVTLPKLMDILLSGSNVISFSECFSQLYFYVFLASTEDILLSSMAYDRYVAICSPLHYQLIMHNRKCVLILLGTWMSGCMNSIFMTVLISNLTLCRSNKIHHFFCEIKALEKISCNNSGFHIIIYVETLLLGVFPFLLSLTSYIKIIRVILSIKSKNGRRKAFSTCTSHLTVLIIFYGTGLCMYVKPPLEHLEEQDQVFSALYAAVTPMVNPLIYSLRNKDVNGALKRIVRSNKQLVVI
ncbi:olfactory receptor 1-like [Spea bombifrons]|uniref:olfactory receptor 1-like n=1 Tax=Spea bombifrons TaxID=233779 RepID=UPI00234A3826|nr:olfactory receptor 1-like [Spea bombifrons]